MWRRAVIGALAAAALAGCGDGDSDLPADTAGICTAVADRFAEIQAEAPKTFPEAEAQLEALVEASRSGDEALADASADGDGEALARYLAARAEVTALLERGLDAVQREEGDAYARVRDDANAGATQRKKLARAAGLPACAEATGRLRPVG